MGLIFTSQTQLSTDVHPGLAFVVLWTSVFWLSMVEGSQVSLVGLGPINKETYKKSHPLSYHCCTIAHKGDNLDRFLMGRQFLVVLNVFIITLSGSPLPDAVLWGFPRILSDIILVDGLALIIFTCMIGQLNSQANAALFQLDYMNNYLAVFTLWVAMGLEFSGILHASYVVQLIVAKLSGKIIVSHEDERTFWQSSFFWFRCMISLAILAFSFTVTLSALLQGKTRMWDGIPDAASVVIFFLLMTVVGLLEGIQIAFFAVMNIPEAERGDAKLIVKTCELLFRSQAQNLPRFMIGRQLLVVAGFFIIARITTPNADGGDSNLLNVPNSVQTFFNTGILGVVVTTIVGSIIWQIVASAFPITYLSNPITYCLIRICLLLEATGVVSGSWIIAAIHQRIAGFQRDEEYIGTTDERSDNDSSGSESTVQLGTGHMMNLRRDSHETLLELLRTDSAVIRYLGSTLLEDERVNGDEENSSHVSYEGG